MVGRYNRDYENLASTVYNKLENCVVIGEVENISVSITQYEFYFALMNSGAGIKNKVLEAMSCGMIVLVNERAIEGFIKKQ